ncbi:MAG: peroxidase [Gemmatimonadetes bacterium]|nr:peroxidase [Gemmatimonadota bacterium]
MRHHGAALRALTTEADWAVDFERDWRETLDRLDPADRALLAYMEKLTLDPATVGAEDVEALRDVGFDDRMIHDAAAVTGYFAFVNRLADGLGVELESYWEDS